MKDNIKCGNSLIDDRKIEAKAFNWQAQFPEIFKQGKFDVVIGNPPWGAEFSNEVKLFLNKNFPIVPSKTKDSYFYFVFKSLNLLKTGGYLGYIVPNTWMLINNAKDIRKKLLDLDTKEIIDYGDGVFGDATVESSTIIIKNENRTSRNILVKRFKRGVHITTQLIEPDIWLKDEYCRIIIEKDSNKQKIIDNLNHVSKRFGEIANIIWGIKPYQVGYGNPPQTKEMMEKRIFHSDKKRGGEWKPLLIGSNVDRYRITFNNNAFVKYGKWLMYPSNEQVMLKPKIVMRQTSDIIRASYDENKFYCQNSLFLIYSEELNLIYLLGLLNSKLLSFVYTLYNPQKGKVFAEIKPSVIKQLPIKLASEKEQQKIISLVNQMLELQKRYHDPKIVGQEKERVEQQIKQLDWGINEEVYKLYGITEEEKKIIEASLK
jgi:hypothetical protein